MIRTVLLKSPSKTRHKRSRGRGLQNHDVLRAYLEGKKTRKFDSQHEEFQISSDEGSILFGVLFHKATILRYSSPTEDEELESTMWE